MPAEGVGGNAGIDENLFVFITKIIEIERKSRAIISPLHAMACWNDQTPSQNQVLSSRKTGFIQGNSRSRNNHPICSPHPNEEVLAALQTTFPKRIKLDGARVHSSVVRQCLPVIDWKGILCIL
jgi:hypothetical protein